ncbi:MAG: hypothetical protein KatS3mg002_0414 [Candidatus Woesearchaeota archaeon]|nr:MAG: hypothetical protein KatS3mg002_0414 [Candidatus Woesearchaeota archaeon]
MIQYASCRRIDNIIIFYLLFSAKQISIESNFIKEKVPGLLLSVYMDDKILEKYEINFPDFENYEIIGYNIQPYRCDVILTPVGFVDDIDQISCDIESDKINIDNKIKFAAIWLA